LRLRQAPRASSYTHRNPARGPSPRKGGRLPRALHLHSRPKDPSLRALREGGGTGGCAPVRECTQLIRKPPQARESRRWESQGGGLDNASRTTLNAGAVLRNLARSSGGGIVDARRLVAIPTHVVDNQPDNIVRQRDPLLHGPHGAAPRHGEQDHEAEAHQQRSRGLRHRGERDREVGAGARVRRVEAREKYGVAIKQEPGK
jgi:hypothetical protein